MTKRGPFLVFLLTFITCGIYGIYWYVVTKKEMNSCGATIPTAWLLIIPFVNYYWLWKFSEGVATVTKGGMSAGSVFLLNFCLGPIGMAIVQGSLNSVAAAQKP
jgi:hypothetical protein